MGGGRIVREGMTELTNALPTATAVRASYGIQYHFRDHRRGRRGVAFLYCEVRDSAFCSSAAGRSGYYSVDAGGGSWLVEQLVRLVIAEDAAACCTPARKFPLSGAHHGHIRF